MQSPSIQHASVRSIAKIPTHSWNVHCLAFSPDSQVLAVATRENVGVSLIDTKTWTIRRTFSEANFPPSSLKFSPNGDRLVLAVGKDEPLRCWDVASGSLIWSHRRCGDPVAFSSDGRLIAISRAKLLIICDARTGEILKELSGHKSSLGAIEFSPDATRIATAAGTQAFLWDAKTGKQVAVLQEKLGGVSVHFSSVGNWLVAISHDGGVRLYDAHSGAKKLECEGHDDMVWDCAFTPDARKIVTIGFDLAVRVWDLPSGQALHRISLPNGITAGRLALAPGGLVVAVPLNHPEHRVGLWSMDSGAAIGSLPVEGVNQYENHSIEVRTSPEGLTFSPNGSWLAAGCNDGTTRVWETQHFA